MTQTNTLVSTATYQIVDAAEELLNDPGLMESFMRKLAGELGLTAHEYSFHLFQPQGLSATLILSESHIATHTWPEYKNAYLTISTCSRAGEEASARIKELVQTVFNARLYRQDEKEELYEIL